MNKGILFFGRSRCQYSKSAVRYLRLLGYDVRVVLSESRKDNITDDIKGWNGEYIISFRSYIIIPVDLIKRARLAAINFHPGPPERPGSGCVNFALYEGDKEYGCTAHLMEKKVDSGPILMAKRFPVLANDTVSTLLVRTHHELLSLFFDVFDKIHQSGDDNVEKTFLINKNGLNWNGGATKLSDLNKLQISEVNIDKEELVRRIRATNTKKFPTKIKLHGYIFDLSPEQ